MLEIVEYLKARYISEKAQGIVEYALILAFVVAVAATITDAGGLQDKVKTAFDNVSKAFGSSAASSGASSGAHQ